MWQEFKACQLYYPERQVMNHLTNSQTGNKCGNGFQIYSQTECVIGNFSLAPQDMSFCPPQGFHVRGCYIDCTGMYMACTE